MRDPRHRSERPAADSGAATGSYPSAAAGNPRGQAASSPSAAGALAGVRRVGVFGGSFDPVHLGHLHVAAQAQAARGLERVVFLPAGRAPHKSEATRAGGEERCAMLALALRGHPDWLVDGLELERPGPSYTIDTIRQVRARWGLEHDARLFLLLGSDNLRGFAQWKDIGELLELTEPVVVARDRDVEATLASLRRSTSPELARRLERALIPCEPLEVSSTEVREALARGAVPAASLPPGVAEYIAARGIYGVRRDPPASPG